MTRLTCCGGLDRNTCASETKGAPHETKYCYPKRGRDKWDYSSCDECCPDSDNSDNINNCVPTLGGGYCLHFKNDSEYKSDISNRPNNDGHYHYFSGDRDKPHKILGGFDREAIDNPDENCQQKIKDKSGTGRGSRFQGNSKRAPQRARGASRRDPYYGNEKTDLESTLDTVNLILLILCIMCFMGICVQIIPFLPTYKLMFAKVI